VSANGARFHVVETGPDDGPLVLLLHGFPQFWWAWRHQLPALAERGYRAVAMDLRGFGASDKPPRGYDTMTSTADVAGVIRSLGAVDAVVVGHGLGGWTAWSMPTLQPRTTRAIAVVAMAHPLRMQAAILSWSALRAQRHVLAFQAPVLPERSVRDGEVVAELLRRWAGPGWPSEEERERYTAAMRIPFVAHSAMEYYRWAVRSLPRPDGRRFAAAVRRTISVPVLQVHGALDGYVLPHRARGSARWVRGRYRWELVDGAGHFPAEEAPQATTAVLVDWLTTL
jgi:pimeloyl-ACP methyl ester carboxylesterase